jgi:hypothetical protein
MSQENKPVLTPREQDEQAIAFEKASWAAQKIYDDIEAFGPVTKKGFKDIVRKKWAYIITAQFYDWKME